jgi:hypothetical protein
MREVGEPAAGIFFTPPDGWEAGMEKGRYVVASEREAGVMLVLMSSVQSLDEARALLREGWVEPGAELLSDGEPRLLAPDTLLAPLRGTVSGQAARAALLCRLSPHGGAVVVLGLAGAEDYSEALAEHARALGASLRFAAPDTAALLAPWDAHLRGRKLVYLAGTSSGGTGAEGPATSASWSEKRELALAADGSFLARTSIPGASGTVDTVGAGGAFGAPSAPGAPGSAGPSAAAGGEPAAARGRWSLVAVAGQPVLELAVPGEEPRRLALSRDGSRTLLDGVRWYIAEE